MKIVHADLETRSRVDLASAGSYRYAVDPSTEILLCGVSESGEDAPVYLWVNPKYETPDLMSEPEALELLRTADLVYGHNSSGFEVPMFWGCSNPVLGVRIQLHQWRDTASLARKAGLPSSLEQCGAALNLAVQKDKEGKRLIKLFSIPQEDGTFVDPKLRPEDWYKFGEYCKTDVRVEKSIHHKLKAFELTGAVLDSFLFDLRMNLRGLPINMTAAQNAQKIIESVSVGVTAEFQELTGLNPTQREKVRVLVGLENMQVDTVAEAKTDDPKTRRILDLYSKLSYAAVKKVKVMLDTACPDNRVRGGHLWYGTVPGRHSGRGLQPQNFKKTPPWMRPYTKEVYQAICDGKDADYLEIMYGEPQELIAGCIRHFIHDPAKTLFDGDYSAIQARTICWLAREQVGLRMWSDYDKKIGPSPYRVMASKIYGIPEPQVDEDQREVGKRVILGAGFQMGASKFQASCLEQYGLSLPIEICELGIKTFRQELEEIPRYWYFLHRSARLAIQFPGTRQGPFVVKELAGMLYLLATLPSGRSIAYPRPEVNKREPTREEAEAMRDGQTYHEDRFLEVTYWGNLKGDNWGRVKLYGGKLAENLTMGCEADIMNHGLIVAEKRGFQPFMLVHDQALSFRTSPSQSAEKYADALADLPPWAAGLPLRVEAKEMPYYSK